MTVRHYGISVYGTYTACKRYAVKPQQDFTAYADLVTCKDCLRVLAAAQEAQA